MKWDMVNKLIRVSKIVLWFPFLVLFVWNTKCINHIWTTEPIPNIISTCNNTGQGHIENIFLPKTLKFIICVKKVLFIRKSMVYYQTLLLCTFTQLKKCNATKEFSHNCLKFQPATTPFASFWKEAVLYWSLSLKQTVVWSAKRGKT